MEVQKNILEHFRDLKIILIRNLIIFTSICILFFYYSDLIFQYTVSQFNVSNINFIFTSLEGSFVSKILISFNIAFILFLPVLVLEGLIYIKDIFQKKLKFKMLYFYAVIFYFTGILITVKFVLPLIIEFFLSIGFFGINFYIDANLFISFLVKIIFCFAFIFQFPIILILLSAFKIITRNQLIKARKYVFILSFVVGALLTPPDVFSQMIAAFLIYCFFEGVIFILKFK
jgi:sec-independent protein translocase protein TatC